MKFQSCRCSFGRFLGLHFEPDGFFMGVDVDKATPKSGVPSSFHLINCALGDLLPWIKKQDGPYRTVLFCLLLSLLMLFSFVEAVCYLLL
ncbi:MAG: hypothetical protein ACYTFK_10795 [Planctomycetota bacterium]